MKNKDTFGYNLSDEQAQDILREFAFASRMSFLEWYNRALQGNRTIPLPKNNAPENVAAVPSTFVMETQTIAKSLVDVDSISPEIQQALGFALRKSTREALEKIFARAIGEQNHD